MKIYYSHSMKIYGTKIEKKEMKIIKENFPNAEIINPPSFESSPRKGIGGMAFVTDSLINATSLFLVDFLVSSQVEWETKLTMH